MKEERPSQATRPPHAQLSTFFIPPPEPGRRVGVPTDGRREAGSEQSTNDQPARSLPEVLRGWQQPRGGPPAGFARIVAIANQKGGVGKTTTAVNLAAALSETGLRVLIVDLDPQGNASTGVGISSVDRLRNSYRVLAGIDEILESVAETSVPGLYALPATIDLAGAEIELVSQYAREARLAKALAPARGSFDYVFVDCPPSLGLLTVNALTAADDLLIPIQCEYYALEGLGQLLSNVRLVRENLNRGLNLSGILLTMFDRRTRLADEVVADVRGHFGTLVYEVVIPRSVRLSEAPGFGLPITTYDPGSKGTRAYRKLAQEVIARAGRDAVRPPEWPESAGQGEGTMPAERVEQGKRLEAGGTALIVEDRSGTSDEGRPQGRFSDGSNSTTARSNPRAGMSQESNPLAPRTVRSPVPQRRAVRREAPMGSDWVRRIWPAAAPGPGSAIPHQRGEGETP